MLWMVTGISLMTVMQPWLCNFPCDCLHGKLLVVKGYFSSKVTCRQRLLQTVARKITCNILMYNISYMNFVENYFVIKIFILMIAILNYSSILR